MVGALALELPPPPPLIDPNLIPRNDNESEPLPLIEVSEAPNESK